MLCQKYLLVCLVLLSLLAPLSTKAEEKNVGQPKPKSPADALKSIITRPELVVELVAAEPLIADPVAFDWAADGSLWVVEMGDYPRGVDGKGKPGGKVRHLTDTDGDGKYDQSDLFLENIPFPTGIKVWRDGVIVSTAPDVFLAKDSDMDGKCDKRVTLFTGFVEGNQQHRVNGLRWGLDGYLHLANGDSGGTITSIKTGKTVDLRGSDLKLNPDTGEMISLFGQTQFGRDRDDWGNWVGGNNSNPMWQYMLDKNRLGENESVDIPDVRHHVSDQPGAAQVFPLSETLVRFNDFDRANRFTSACSPMFYRDTFLGEGFYGNAFICEPVHNLVHREIVERDGLFLKSTRAADEQGSEFLASSDNWFRPTMIRTGPDGALWIADMYRLVIEHPEWIPDDWQQRLDLRSGDDMGRIYRVYRRETKPKIPNIAELTNPEIVDQLRSSNGPLRDMAQQELFWRADDAQLERVREVAGDKRLLPQARLQALWTMQMLEKPTKASIEDRLRIAHTALEDDSADIRAWGVQFCAATFGDQVDSLNSGGAIPSEINDIVNRLREMLQHESMAIVQLELAYEIDKLSPAVGGESLFNLLLSSADNPFIRAALYSNIVARNVDTLATGPWEKLPDDQLTRFLTAIVSVDETGAIAEGMLIRRILGEPQKFSSLLRRIISLDAVLSRLKPDQKLESSELDRELTMFLKTVRQVAIADNVDALLRLEGTDDEKLQTRKAAISLLRLPRAQSSEILFLLLANSEPLEIQTAALDSLMHLGTKEAGERLLQHWANAAPTIRNQIINSMIQQKNWTPLFLDALERREISVSSLSAAQLDRLSNSLATRDRERLANISPLPSSFDREMLIKKYADAMKKSGDATSGAAIFAKTCAACHRLGESGTAVGPDLAALTDKSTNTLLKAILDPNAAVEQKYLNYIVETSDGLQHAGVLVQESSGSIKLMTSDRKEVNLLRKDIESLTSGKSFMPEGVEKEIDAQQMADLIAFLQSSEGPSKVFPNNKPETIRIEDDGSYRLPASKARIYGPSLIFEQGYKNLGWWSHVDDHAEWTLEIKHEGKYRVVLEYAVENSAANNQLMLQFGEQKIVFKVTGTGTWDDFVEVEIAEVELPVCNLDVIARSAGPIKSALIDLREIKLIPK
jgi:putative membrane-bound dehydrogenase-like protein